MKRLLLCFFLSSALILRGQEEIIMKEVVVSGVKSEQRRSDISNQITVLKNETIQNTPINNMGDLLEKKANIYVQRSQLGGASPVIRGFEASRVLIMIDGVRMNNPIYRAGHLQNVITLDNYYLDHVEVISGPGSLIYGSDALGGVMAFYTQKPILQGDSPRLALRGSVSLQYSTALQGKKANALWSMGGKKFSSLTGFTFSDYGGLRVGSNNSSAFGDWTLNTKYSRYIDGKDSGMVNPSSNDIQNTAYQQYDGIQKFLFKPNGSSEYILNLQASNSGDIPRTDRLNILNSKGQPTNAEWSYGPQTRLFASLQANYKMNHRFVSKISITGAFQKIHESRITRSFGSDIRTTRFENVSMATFNVDAVKFVGAKHGIFYGAEFLYSEVYSIAPTLNIKTGASGINSTRYPENGSFVRSFSFYAKDDYRFSDMLTVSAGMRMNVYSLNAHYLQQAQSAPFTDVLLNNVSIVGNIAINYHPCDDYKIYVMLSSGYRSPNVDDLGKFAPDPALNRVVVPNAQLQAEKLYNLEFAWYQRTSSRFEMEFIPYVSYFHDFLSMAPSTYHGQDSILADGQILKVYAFTNKTDGLNAGASFRMKYRFYDAFVFYTHHTYTYGRNLTDHVPMDHIAPLYGTAGLEYKKSKYLIDLNVKYNAAKPVYFYGPIGSEDNIEYATPQGTPGWWTLNIGGHYDITKNFKATLAVDNILDMRYRPFSSTITAPGVNVMVGLRMVL